MTPWRTQLALVFLFAWAASAAGQKFELRGGIDPPPKMFSAVQLHGQDFPYEASTTADGKGNFRFKKIDPGQYTVIVAVPGRGTVRRTVNVSAAKADQKRRVHVTIPFQPSTESIEAAATVSLGELTVPPKAEREYEKAQKRLNRRDVEGAIRHLEKAVEIAPHYTAAWNNLGTIAYQSGRYEDAEKYFRSALEHEPGAYSPVVNLGGTLLSLNRFEEALEYNEYAVKMRPDEALPNSQLGMNHHYLGDDDNALEYLTKAKEIDPNHFSHPQLLLAKIYIRRGDSPAAAAELNDFLDRHPNSQNADTARRWLQLLRDQPRIPPAPERSRQ